MINRVDRVDRVAELLRRELSVILTEIEDRVIAGVAITRVEMTRDLMIAKVFYTVHDEVTHKNEIKEALESHVRFIRGEVASRVDLKFVPSIVFHEDELVEHKRHMDSIFEKIAKERGESIPDESGEKPGATDEK
ncbi:MAG TPA: 30S ribosome-binding factor RbfA [Candidatus Omnitrophota bacterium]|nr:30S ribosome-binding factor RbfA [Candidatus Omnitrophota bacterium]HPS20305.1 30S ribosome-binding factor RbfA [Candidatus Omnitrophota bacterium]